MAMPVLKTGILWRSPMGERFFVCREEGRREAEMIAGKKEDGRMKANVQCSIFNVQCSIG